MGLFSRRKSTRPTDDGSGGASPRPETAAPHEAGAPTGSGPTGVGGDAPDGSTRRGAAGGLVEHRSLQAALAAWAERKDSVTFHDVVRELPVGELLLDISGSTLADRSQGLRPGDLMTVTHQIDSSGKKVLLAYTSNQRLADHLGTSETTSLGQPATAVLAQVVAQYDGLALDPGSPGQFIVYRDELVQGLGGDVTAPAPVKQALTERTLPWPELLELLRTSTSLYRAELPTEVADGADAAASADRVTVPTATDPDGGVWSVLHSSPAEVFAWAPGAAAQRVPFSAVAAVALEHEHAGIVVDPRGPSVTVVADELRALVSR